MKMLEKIKSVNFKNLKLRKSKKAQGKRMIIIKKKQLASVVLILLVAAAGYLNYSMRYDIADPDAIAVYKEASKKLGEAQMVNADEASDEKKQSLNGYFSEARLQRETKREESIDTLLELINSDGADKAAKAVAEEQITELAMYTEKEVTMENMIKAKGYQDAVVFMGENLVSVAVFSAGLNEVDAAIISDIATSVTGLSADKVNIVEIGE